MAEISGYVEKINAAKNGAEARQPIAEALNILNTQGRETDKLSDYNGSYLETDLARQSEMGKILPMDRYPRKNSNKLVTSGGIWSIIGDFDDFDWGDDEWQI